MCGADDERDRQRPPNAEQATGRYTGLLNEGVVDFRAEFGAATVGLSLLGLTRIQRNFAPWNEVEGDGT